MGDPPAYYSMLSGGTVASGGEKPEGAEVANRSMWGGRIPGPQQLVPFVEKASSLQPIWFSVQRAVCTRDRVGFQHTCKPFTTKEEGRGMTASSEVRDLEPLWEEDAMGTVAWLSESSSSQMCSDSLRLLLSPTPNSQSFIAPDGNGEGQAKGKADRKEAERS